MSATIKELLTDGVQIEKLTKLAFDMVDTDSSGYIDRNELEAVMTSIGLEMDFDGASKEDVDEIIKELDTDDDGKINYAEWKKLVVEILTVMSQNEPDKS